MKSNSRRAIVRSTVRMAALRGFILGLALERKVDESEVELTLDERCRFGILWNTQTVEVLTRLENGRVIPTADGKWLPLKKR